MDMKNKLGHFLEYHGSPLFVGSLTEGKMIFVNESAKKLFGVDVDTCDMTKIFDKPLERILSLANKSISKTQTTLLYNYTVLTKEQKKILVDMQVGYFNDQQTEVFLEIIPQGDMRMKMAEHQIKHSPRAEAILNLDENLSIVDCNEAFHKVFESSEELRHSHFKNDLVNGFLPEVRDKLMADIHNNLRTGEIFSTDVKVFTAKGEERWYRFDLQKRELDNSGMKLMCYMVNIEKQVRIQEEVSSLSQYFEALQSISGESFYTVDVKTKILTQKGQVAEELGFFGVVENFPDSVFYKVHSEDLEQYKQFTYDSLEGIAGKTRVRVLTAQGDYQWYEILCEIVRDKQGEISEVVGKMNNVHKEMSMEAKVTTLNQYFDTLKSNNNESLYIYDIQTKRLNLSGLTEKELGLPCIVEDFPESLLHLVHSGDLEMYQNFLDSARERGKKRLELRLKNVDGRYQWYELLSEVIFDERGNPKEIFGKIKNIQERYDLKSEVKELTSEMEEANNYLLVMQELSDDILYRINVETMTLVYTTKTKTGEIVTHTYENYPESTFDSELIYLDDRKIILEQTENWLQGNMTEHKLRLKLVTEDYQWYLDSAINVRDKQGKIKEIYGRLKNIHGEETMVAEVSTLNQYVEAVQSLSGESLFYVDMKTKVLRQKGEVAVELGLPEEVPNFPEGAYGLIHPEELEIYKNFTRDTLEGRASSVQCRVRTASGAYQWYEIIAKHIYNDSGEMVEIFGRMTNIHKEMTIKADFTVLNQYFTAMQNLSKDILFHIDVKTKVFRHADKHAESFGVPLEIHDFVNVFIANGFIRPEDGERYRDYTEKLLSGENMEFEIEAAVGVGIYQWFNITSQYIYNQQGEAVEIFGMMENIQKQKDLEKKASHDLMTKVLNKVSFEEESALIMSSTFPQMQHALIFIDLDDFKGVNDSLGHSFGDVLLTTVGKRLKRHVRDHDLVGRIGGDEFAVLLCNISSKEAVLDRTSIMLESLQRNFTHEGESVGIKASLGVAIYPEHGETYKDLIGKADIAVYESKRRGKNVVTMYDSES